MNPSIPNQEIQQPKPKRPLSAFNLFYRFKRQKVLDALAADSSLDKEKICGLVTSPPGVEHHHHAHQAPAASADMLNAMRRKNIRLDLESNLDPRDTKRRSHRKNQGAMNGAMSFVELGKLMNSSWKACDPFAKSIFDELAGEGREKYRLLKAEYAKASLESDKGSSASVVVKKKKKDRKQLPTKKNKAAKKKKSSPRSSSKDIGSESEEESAMNETAEVMVQLAKYSPPIDQKMLACTVVKNENSSAAAPSLLDLLSKNTEVSAQVVVPKGDLIFRPSFPQEMLPRIIPPIVPNPSIAINPSTIAPPPLSSIGEDPRLILRVRELEGQLAAERLQARVRQLEVEMSHRRAREGFLRSVLDNTITQNRASVMSAVACHPPALFNQHAPAMPQDGLWSLVSASMIHPSVQASERDAMLSRIVEPHRHNSVTRPSKRPSPTSSRDKSSVPGSLVNKKQRLS